MLCILRTRCLIFVAWGSQRLSQQLPNYLPWRCYSPTATLGFWGEGKYSAAEHKTFPVKENVLQAAELLMPLALCTAVNTEYWCCRVLSLQ